ncbi:hypothetical protein M3Y94_00278200 [Aphelenchoides besseyi]|nr:hypothetical protein M3Y94_00278200 [Aphelenchoides besseyi]KAI6236022.1 Zinc finger and Nuclear hormone receptor domain containing protein [Aphelenchoides besseyi]
MPNCLVCDEKNTAARHYNSVCCSGCKGFFRRSVRFRRQYVCAYDKHCSIKREYRNCCRACRFQKCLDIGLDPLMVHSDRSCDNREDGTLAGRDKSEFLEPELPVSTTNVELSTSSNSLIKETTNMVSVDDADLRLEHAQNLANLTRCFMLNPNNNEPLGNKGIICPFDSRDFSSVKRYFTLVERLIDGFHEHVYGHLHAVPPLHHFNLNVTMEKAFLSEPRCVSDRSFMDWEPKFMITPLWYSRCWSRLIVYYVDWVSHIPQLQELDERERIHLTIGRLAPCIWHIIANRSAFLSGGKKRVLLSGGTYYPLEDQTVDANLQKFLHETAAWVWSEVVEPAIQMNVTEAEFALLRVICFLTPVPLLSRKAKTIIRNAQNYYRSVLTELVVNCSSTSDFLVLSKRLSSILMLLTPLEKTTQIEDENMAVMTMFDLNGMHGELLFNLYVRRVMRF